MNREREHQPASVPSVRMDKQAGEDLRETYGADRGIWTKPMLIALHEGRVKGNKWFSLIDKVASERTLGIAWDKVASNAGACGVDRVTISHFEKDSQKRLLAVKEHLNKGDYQAQPIRRVHIPKAGSKEKRPLGIPTIRDRVVQGAVKMVIEPIFEREFSANSYGFRPGRGCKNALSEVERLLHQGHLQVVDIDIKGYFDDIPHSQLMTLVRQKIADGKVLALIEEFLKQGVMEEAGLQLHLEKTRVVDMSEADAHFDFLGYRFKRSKRGRLMRLVRPKSKQKLRAELKKTTKRCNARSMESIIGQINIHLPGWYGYFKQAETSDLAAMDGWVRMRLRSILRKRHKKKGRGRGIDHKKWPNRYFEELGLFGLKQAKVTEMSLLKRDMC